jgi:hypothetical protein
MAKTESKIQSDAADSRITGSRRRAAYQKLEELKEPAPPIKAADVLDLLAHTLMHVRSGRIDPRQATAVTSLAMASLRALEICDIQSRIEALEHSSRRTIRRN